MSSKRDAGEVQLPLSDAEVKRIKRLLGIVATVSVVGALLFWFATTLRADGRHDMFNLVDVSVYRAGAEALLQGRPLYEPVFGPLYFTYPPFAALLFLPAALVGDALLKGIWVVGSAALIAWVVTSVSRETRVEQFMTEATVWKFSIALAVVIDPVWVTIYLGQINLVILALVLADFLLIASGRRRRWGGILLGIAISIKLTPVIFVGLLIVLRQFRAALMALLTFAATVLITLVLIPRTTITYWTYALFDTQRISPSDVAGNQSWAGILFRQFDGPVPPGLWFTLAAITGIIGLAVAFRLVRLGHTVAGVGAMGIAGCAASPFSWGHHWVWLLLVVTWGAGMAIQYLVVRSRIATFYVILAIISFLVSARYFVGERGSMGSWAIYLDHPIGTWALSYPVVGTALMVAIGIFAWTKPAWFAHVLEPQPASPDRDLHAARAPGSVPSHDTAKPAP